MGSSLRHEEKGYQSFSKEVLDLKSSPFELKLNQSLVWGSEQLPDLWARTCILRLVLKIRTKASLPRWDLLSVVLSFTVSVFHIRWLVMHPSLLTVWGQQMKVSPSVLFGRAAVERSPVRFLLLHIRATFPEQSTHTLFAHKAGRAACAIYHRGLNSRLGSTWTGITSAKVNEAKE